MSQKTAEAVRPAETSAEKSHEQHTTLREYIESLLVTVLLALFVTTFVVQAFKIPSESMEPTLLVGDHLLVNKFIFGGRDHWYDRALPYRSVRRGDVIVFKFPYQDHPHYVKRVIGMPGDRLKIVDQQVYVNGQLLREPYVQHDPDAPYDAFLYNFPPTNSNELLPSMQPEWANSVLNYVHDGEIVVPPNHYFAMGDNRDHSWDSRYWGFVDREAIMGGPVVIYWSVKATEEEEESPGTIGETFNELLHLPALTRWNRMFHTVH